MKTKLIYVAALLVSLTLGACNIKVEDKKEDNLPVFNELDVARDLLAIDEGRTALSKVGIRFVPVTEPVSGDVKSYDLDMKTYQDFRAQHPDANDGEKLIRLKNEIRKLNDIIDAHSTVAIRYPGAFKVKKSDGTVEAKTIKTDVMKTYTFEMVAAGDLKSKKEQAIKDMQNIPKK